MSREGMQGSQHGGEATEHGRRMEKTMRTRKKKKKNPTGENHGSSTAPGRRQKKPTVYTTGVARTTGEHCLVLCADKTKRAPGPSPNCSGSWAVI